MMTDAEAAAFVRKIKARPTNAAFDCAAGAIVRLFARIDALEKRMRKLEHRGGFGAEVGIAPHLASATRPRRSDRHSAPIIDNIDTAMRELEEYRRRM